MYSCVGALGRLSNPHAVYTGFCVHTRDPAPRHAVYTGFCVQGTLGPLGTWPAVYTGFCVQRLESTQAGASDRMVEPMGGDIGVYTSILV